MVIRQRSDEPLETSFLNCNRFRVINCAIKLNSDTKLCSLTNVITGGLVTRMTIVINPFSSLPEGASLFEHKVNFLMSRETAIVDPE